MDERQTIHRSEIAPVGSSQSNLIRSNTNTSFFSAVQCTLWVEWAESEVGFECNSKIGATPPVFETS